MNRIKLKNLKIKAFRSFKNQEDVGSLPTSGIVGIKGRDETNNTPSGAGKTNFHLAISYALGYCPFPGTALQNWATKDPLQVELELESNLGSAIIKRGDEYSFSLNGEVVKGSAKAVDGAIRKFIGMPIDLLDPLTFRQQDTDGRFLSMTDPEKKDFLSVLLGLDEIETQIELSKKSANELEKDIASKQTQIQMKQTLVWEPVEPEFESTEAQKERLKAIFAEYKESMAAVESLSSQIKGIEGQIVMINGSLRSETDDDLVSKYEYERYTGLIEAKKQEIEAYQSTIKAKIKTFESAITELRKEVSKKSAFEERLKATNHLIEGLRKGVCPTCSNNWITEPHKLEDLEKSAAELVAMIDSCVIFQTKINETMVEVEKLQKSYYVIDQDGLTELINKRASIETERIQKSLDFNAAQNEKKKPLNRALVDLNAKFHAEMSKQEGYRLEGQKLDSDIKRIKEVSTLKLKTYHENVANVIKVKNEIGELNAQLAITTAEYNEESDFAALLKAFLGAIFEEVLLEIENETNDMLRYIPNVSGTTVRFTTESSTQKGKIKQEIKALVRKNDVEIPLKAGLSGGQLSSINLAVDLAVGTVIGRRTNVAPAWLILDEPFRGLGASDIEVCFELLRKVAKDRLIFIIEHNTEANELYDVVINISSTDGVSTIKR